MNPTREHCEFVLRVADVRSALRPASAPQETRIRSTIRRAGCQRGDQVAIRRQAGKTGGPTRAVNDVCVTWVTLVFHPLRPLSRPRIAPRSAMSPTRTSLLSGPRAGLDRVGHGHVGRPWKALEMLRWEALVVRTSFTLRQALTDVRRSHRRAHESA